MSKKLSINCGSAILIRDNKEIFEGYDEGHINAGSILISTKMQKELNNMNFSINAGNITAINVDGNVYEIEKDAHIVEGMNFENCFIISKGNLIIESRGVSSLATATGIYASDTVYVPDFVNLSSVCKIYSNSIKTYPEGFNVKLGDLILTEDAVFALKNTYVTGLLTAFDENALKHALDMNLKLKSVNLLTTTDILNKYSGVLSYENYTLVKENHELIKEDIILDDSVYAIYGDKIYVIGDLKLNPKDIECLNDFTSIIVKGCAKIPFSSFKHFKQIGNADEVFLYKGELLDVDGCQTISKAFLNAAKLSGITYTINVDGILVFDEDVLDQDLECIHAIYYDGVIEVSDDLKPSVMIKIKKGDGVIRNLKDKLNHDRNKDSDDFVKINIGNFVL